MAERSPEGLPKEGDMVTGGKATMVAALAAVLLGVVIPAAVAAAADGRIQQIGVRLDLTDATIGPDVLDQLEAALMETAELALMEQLGGEIDYINQNMENVVSTLGGVINTVLNKRGFELEELELQLGEITLLNIKLKLNDEQVQYFQVHFYLLGNTQLTDAIIRPDEEQIASVLYSTLASTPYEDELWVSNMILDTVTEELEGIPAYADYDFNVLVQPGETAEVGVTFERKAAVPLLKGYDLHTRSITLAQFNQRPVRTQLNHYFQALTGAPLSFIEAKLPEIRDALYQLVVNHSALSTQLAEAGIELSLEGDSLLVELHIESERYMFTVDMRQALHNYDSELGIESRVRARLGIIPAKSWNFYLTGSYFPGENDVYPALSAGYLFDTGMVSAGYDFEAATPRFAAQFDFSPQFYIDADIFSDDDYNHLSEIGLHYRLKDYYELQLVRNFDGEFFAAVAANF
jgi:hypothetical protein